MFPTLISGTYLECMARLSRVYRKNQGNSELIDQMVGMVYMQCQELKNQMEEYIKWMIR